MTPHEMASQSLAPASTEPPAAPVSARAAWVMFDWANQPLYTLILSFLFAPYFANVVVGEENRGQALWGYAAAVAGLLIAVGSPFLGAVADGSGRRKVWMAAFLLVMVPAMALLWFSPPHAGAGEIVRIMILFVLATLGAEYSAVFANAMMPTLVPPSGLGRLSGLSYAVGYAGGLVSLILMAGFIVTSPDTGRTLLGLAPVLSLDAASRASDRLTGPFCALWYVVFMLPFFALVPDRPVPRPAGHVSPMTELFDTLRRLPEHPSLMRFLIARAIFVDGLSAIFTFGGIYGAAVFGWQAFELGLFGIILSVMGALGSLSGGVFDDRLGARAVILFALLVLIVGALGILSVTAHDVLFFLPVAAKAPGSPPFSSMGELVYLGFAMAIGFVAGPTQASSRSLLARLAPPERMTQHFGLFAFSGKVTAFLAPFLIALTTQATGSQRLGVAVVLAFLVTGFVLMLTVREARPA